MSNLLDDVHGGSYGMRKCVHNCVYLSISVCCSVYAMLPPNPCANLDYAREQNSSRELRALTMTSHTKEVTIGRSSVQTFSIPGGASVV